LVQQYYQNVDFSKWEDVRKLPRVYAEVLGHIINEAVTRDWGHDDAAGG